MQAGLLDTYHRPASSRAPVAWLLSAALLSFYLLLYFGPVPALGLNRDLVQAAAETLGLGSKWTLYGLLYTLAMVLGGIYFLRRHGNSRYERVRTIVVVAVQVVLAFALPVIMQVFGRQEYYFSYFWPLKIEYFYPSLQCLSSGDQAHRDQCGRIFSFPCTGRR